MELNKLFSYGKGLVDRLLEPLRYYHVFSFIQFLYTRKHLNGEPKPLPSVTTLNKSNGFGPTKQHNIPFGLSQAFFLLRYIHYLTVKTPIPTPICAFANPVHCVLNQNPIPHSFLTKFSSSIKAVKWLKRIEDHSKDVKGNLDCSIFWARASVPMLGVMQAHSFKTLSSHFCYLLQSLRLHPFLSPPTPSC